MSKSNVISFYTLLENRKVEKTGLFPLCLVVYFNGKKRRYRTGTELEPEQWKQIRSPKLRDKDLKEIKNEIKSFIDKAEGIREQFKKNNTHFTFDEFEKEYFQKDTGDIPELTFEQCTREYIKDYKKHSKGKQLSLKTKIMYETVINSLNGFKWNIGIKQITPELLSEYEDHLTAPIKYVSTIGEKLTKKGKSVSTVGVYLRQIRAVINYAISKKYFPAEDYPFKKYDVPTAEPNKRALSNEEIKALIYYKTESEQEQKAIDFFTFSYLGNGLNFCDIAGLRYSNIKGDYINFYRTKTKNKKSFKKEIDIFLLPQMKRIIKKYGNPKESETDFIFPIINENMNPKQQFNSISHFIKFTNEYLKRISSALKFDFNCTTYYARHSWATKMRNSGVSVSYISEGLGHSNISTTENYLSKFPTKQVKENASKLLDL